MTDRSEIRVRRWTYPKDRGGTGGLIPSDCQEPLLLAAIRRGIPLTPDHFFPHVVPAAASLLASSTGPDLEAAE